MRFCTTHGADANLHVAQRGATTRAVNHSVRVYGKARRTRGHCRSRRGTAVDDGEHFTAARSKSVSGGIGVIVVGEHHEPVAGARSIFTEVTANSRGQHDTGAIVARKH